MHTRPCSQHNARAGRALCARTNATGSLYTRSYASKRERRKGKKSRARRGAAHHERASRAIDRRTESYLPSDEDFLCSAASSAWVNCIRKQQVGKRQPLLISHPKELSLRAAYCFFTHKPTASTTAGMYSESDEVPRPLLGTRTCCNFRNRFRCKTHFLVLFRKKIGIFGPFLRFSLVGFCYWACSRKRRLDPQHGDMNERSWEKGTLLSSADPPWASWHEYWIMTIPRQCHRTQNFYFVVFCHFIYCRNDNSESVLFKYC